MKATIELPDELMREIKLKAVREDRKLKDLVAELLQKGLTQSDSRPRKGERVKFPLIKGTRPADPAEEVTPERLKEILLEEDVAAFTQ